MCIAQIKGTFQHIRGKIMNKILLFLGKIFKLDVLIKWIINKIDKYIEK